MGYGTSSTATFQISKRVQRKSPRMGFDTSSVAFVSQQQWMMFAVNTAYFKRAIGTTRDPGSAQENDERICGGCEWRWRRALVCSATQYNHRAATRRRNLWARQEHSASGEREIGGLDQS